MKTIDVMRIYQGKVMDAHFVGDDVTGGKVEALQALEQTHRLFQDAVNYHLVALAGMADVQNATVGGKFREQVKAIWREHPRGDAYATTLQQSVCRTLRLGNVSFEEAVSVLFEGCGRPDILPYVQQYVIDRTAKGGTAIQQEGRDLLPKLCHARFSGNFEYSSAGKKASEMKLRLVEVLNAAQEASGTDEFISFARSMDLSWVGIKTQPGKYWNEAETKLQIQKEMDVLIQTLKGDPREQKIRDMLARTQPDATRLLAKNNKCNLSLKRAALFFMYYPCLESAEMLKAELGGKTKKKHEGDSYDYTALEDDALVLARGQRGYVYRGFTALPAWEAPDGLMYEKEWDILAFKEALKALHGFSLKMEERRKLLLNLEEEIAYIQTGEGKPKQNLDEEVDASLAVLGGDRRYELLGELVRELRQDEDDRDYRISSRSIKGWNDMVGRWKELIRRGEGDTASLQAAVREQQGKHSDFGSQVLFHALCEEKYRPIWQAEPPLDGKPRSRDILKDFGSLQEKEREAARLREPVRLTAAEPRVSPRPLMYSDLVNLGAKSKGCQFVKRQEGVMHLRVVVQNSRGRWQGATIQVHYSSPRMLRDQLGVDADKWPSGKKGAEPSVPWMQPMLTALGIKDLPILEKKPAVSLEINYRQGDEESLIGHECLLNFPVTLDMAPLQKALGVASQWEGQFNGTREEKLHLHWPDTYSGKSTPWWEQKALASSGFDVLSVDLGVRYAAAWTLMLIAAEEDGDTSGDTRPRRLLGRAGGVDWYGRARHTGFIRLAGEWSPKKAGERSSEVIRLATEGERIRMERLLRGQEAEMSWSAEKGAVNILRLNNRAVKFFRRMLSRYRFFLRFLAGLSDTERQEKTLQEVVKYMEWSQRELIPGIREAMDKKELGRISRLLEEELDDMRRKLPRMAEAITQGLLPRRKGAWVWESRRTEGMIGAGIMKPAGKETYGKEHYLYRMGGLSVARLAQLEEWRRCLQSMSRLLAVIPGQKPLVGRASRGVAVQDPCPDILRKIENMRTERVNEIAHAIAAQALGVRLVQPARKGKNSDGKDVFHGEYERIPGRKPVSFVVLENLSSYRTHIDHSREENTTLTRWMHRHIVAKVVELLQEVYGIPVVLTHAAYTSQFDCMTSAPGFRADVMNRERWQRQMEKKGEKKDRGVECYEKVWERLPQGVALYMPSPTNSGEFFISCVPGGEPVVRNADRNAAVNIAWRALASPQALDLLHKIRMEKGAKGIGLLQKSKRNKREKVLDEKSLEICGKPEVESGEFRAFYGGKASAPAVVKLGGVPLCHGKEMWGRLKRSRWLLCHRLNVRILKKVGIPCPELEAWLKEENDDIPC